MGQVKPLLPVPNVGLARQELMKFNAGDDKHLAIAIQDTLVRKASIEEIKEVLRYAMMKLGLRAQNLPSEIEKILIIQHVTTIYGGHTLEEIRLAFDMAIARKLPVDSNCYENFSCEYISRIMEAYRTWAAQEIREMPAPLPLPSPNEPKENLSSFAMLRWLAQEIRFIKTGKPVEFVPHQLYDYLDGRGKIAATKAEKREYFEKAIAWRLNDLQKEVEQNNSVDNRERLHAFRWMRDQRRFTIPEYEGLQRFAKKLLFFDLVHKHS